ncbi:MAG: Fic family protein [Polyangiales bacterium]
MSTLSEATLHLGRLDGIAARVPNPDLFVAMYVRQEAVLSSQIEGTQASLTEVLQFEAGMDGDARVKDAAEVSNYVRAMNMGLERLATLPLSKRLVREIHCTLLENSRGTLLTPGEFRTSQNWIGAPGCVLTTARFVPPPPRILHDVLDAWERFLHDESFPPLIQAALAHAQFETIHPFLDGNGRIGRLLITFLLCTRGVLKRPLLYLSAYLKRNRAEYYDRLQAVRENGHWEQWVRFFLRGVAEVAKDATATADRVLDLQRELHQKVLEDKRGPNLLKTLDHLFLHPAITVAQLQSALAVSTPTANSLMSRCVELGILHEITGHKRNRWFHFVPFLELFESASTTRLPEPPAAATRRDG